MTPTTAELIDGIDPIYGEAAEAVETTNTVKHTPLLPCPFCGGEASGDSKVTYSDRHAKEQGWGQATFFYVNCIRCGSDNKGIVGHHTRDDAAAAWNRRSPAPQEKGGE